MKRICVFLWHLFIYLAVQQLGQATGIGGRGEILPSCYSAPVELSCRQGIVYQNVTETTATTCFVGKASPLKIKIITILSLDGGGVRGILVARMLSALEERFQALHGKDARIADHVDVIAGVSTGGLIAAMLASPDENGRPMFQAKDIVDFYIQKCAKIFPQSKFMRACRYTRSFFRGPIYSGKKLGQVIIEMIPELRLKDTITNLVIPTYDMKDEKAIVFTTYKARKETLMNPYLKDICIGTSAAPIYLPPHGFNISDKASRNSNEFNLIDGGVVANDPVRNSASS